MNININLTKVFIWTFKFYQNFIDLLLPCSQIVFFLVKFGIYSFAFFIYNYEFFLVSLPETFLNCTLRPILLKSPLYFYATFSSLLNSFEVEEMWPKLVCSFFSESKSPLIVFGPLNAEWLVTEIFAQSSLFYFFNNFLNSLSAPTLILLLLLIIYS
jgi:hypothetical protein